jgi:hypothetical protein
VYEAEVKLDMVTTYYLFVGSSSAKLRYNDLPFASLMGMPPAPDQAQAETAAKSEATP